MVHGKVLRTAQFGAFVEIAEGVEGLCHISEASEVPGEPSKLEAGQEHDFKIIKINVEEKKVGLSLRAVPATKPAAPRFRTTSRKHAAAATSSPSPAAPPLSAISSTGARTSGNARP